MEHRRIQLFSTKPDSAKISANSLRHDHDRQMDYLRGIAIIWVVAVHVFYFKQFVPPTSVGRIFKAIMIFEMPLLFFVSGASLYYSHQARSSIRDFLNRRMRRLLLPYLLLAIICSSLFYARELVSGRALDLSQIESWLLLRPWPVVPYYVSQYMWFIRVVIAVTIAHLVLVRLFLRDRLRLPTAVALAVGIIAFTFVGKPIPDFFAAPIAQLPQYAVFYGAFGYIGYYYASNRLSRRPWLPTLVFTVTPFLLLALIVNGIVAADAQTNKFPPNVGYALLGITWLAIWLFLLPAVAAVANRLIPVGQVLRFFSTHSYTVYLYHGFAFYATDQALSYLHIFDWPLETHYGVRIVTYFAIALPTTALTTAMVDHALAHATRIIRHQSRLHQQPVGVPTSSRGVA